MQDREGPFSLGAVVGQDMGDRGKWKVAGFVHADGESDPVEWVQLTEKFKTREDATAAGIAAARNLAATLPVDHSNVKKRREIS